MNGIAISVLTREYIIVNRSSRSVEHKAPVTHIFPSHLRVKSARPFVDEHVALSVCVIDHCATVRALRYPSALLNIVIYHACVIRLLRPTAYRDRRTITFLSVVALVNLCDSVAKRYSQLGGEKERDHEDHDRVKRAWTINISRDFNRLCNATSVRR